MSEYKTKQRELLVNFLTENRDRHFTAGEIELALAHRGEKLGKATVYRRLERLVEEGVVRRFVSDGERVSCYQFAGGDECKNHYHLKCLRCGDLLHVECSYLDEMSKHVRAHHGFEVSTEKITLCGVCEKCAKI